MTTPELTTDIVILGGGMGGYTACRTLIRELKQRRLPHQVLLIDKNNFSTFVPMLHEVVSGAVEPSHLAVPLRELVYGTPHAFLKAAVSTINPEQKTIVTDKGTVRYRHYCVLALGSGVNYFGVPGAEQYTYHVRTLPMARRLQRDLISALENGQTNVNLTIVGGGYTGVELAGNMGHYINRDIKKLFPAVKITTRLVENGAAILSSLPTEVQQKAVARLRQEGIELMCGSPVTEVRPDGVAVNGTIIPSDFTVWCSGVRTSGDQFCGTRYSEKGRVRVNEWLHMPSDKRLYVIGDVACGYDRHGQLLPQLGAVATAQGTYVGRRLARLLTGKQDAERFNFRLKGLLIPVGRWYGIGVFGNWVIDGRLMWLLRCAVYLLYIPGLVRKIKIAIDWLLHSMWFRYIIHIERVSDEYLAHKK